MLNKHINSYILLCTSVLTISCSVTNQTQQNAVPLAALSNEPVITRTDNDRIFAWGGTVSLPEGITNDDYQDMYRQYLKSDQYQQHEKIIRLISRTNSWQEADQFTRKFIGETENDRLAFVHQAFAAASMLRGHFMYMKPTREIQIAMAYYLDVLKKNKSFQEINLFVQILPKMQGYWSNEKITEYATVVIGDYNTRRSIPITGKAFSTETYFVDKAKNLARSASSLNSGTATSNDPEADIQQTAKTLQTDFVGNIDLMLDKARSTFDQQKTNNRWHIPTWDSIVLLGMIAEGKLGKK